MAKTDPIIKLDFLPFPKAAIVKYVKEVDEDGEGVSPEDAFFTDYIGRQFLIYEVDDEGMAYSIFGHSELGTQGIESGWHHHSCFELVEQPSIKSWGMLLGAKPAADDDDDDADEDEDEDGEDE